MGHNPVSRTPIVYYGGKTGMLAHILPLIPPHEVYTEAFFGGGAVFWAKDKAKNETINDRLDIVINFYEQLKWNYPELNRLIQASLISRSHHHRAQRMLRRPESCSKVERAWAFWFLSNFSFTNKLTGGVKYSNDRNSVVPEVLRSKKARFTEWLVERIEDAHIENTDALQVLRSRNVQKAFHYIDPPYFNADQGHYRGYTERDFNDLLDVCAGLQGRFILSNYRSDILSEYVARYGWHTKEVTKRLMTPMVKEKDKTEVLVWNYEAQSITSQIKLF